MNHEETITRLKNATLDHEEIDLITHLAEAAGLIEPWAHKRLKQLTADIADYNKKGHWEYLALFHQKASQAATSLQDLNYKRPAQELLDRED